MAITNYQIEMLNVGDADAFIVYYLTDDGGEHLVLIDAGRYNDGEKVLNILNSNYKDIPVELAIVTHPDDDHFGGFIYLLEQIQQKSKNLVPIQQFWINDPRNHFKPQDVKEDLTKKELEERLEGVFASEDKNLLKLIDSLKIYHEEKFARTGLKYIGLNETGDRVYKKTPIESSQPGFYVVGPTLSTFESLSTEFRYKKKLTFVEEVTEDLDIEDEEGFVSSNESLSRVLDDAENDPSRHNISSLILLFKPNNETTYLFTGDASTESFGAMDALYQEMCKNVTWMKLPHHGSKHNLNTKWIKHFNPHIVYISTLRRGKYLNQCTINALKNNGCQWVVSTHNNEKFSSIVHNNFQERRLDPNIVLC